MSGVTVAHGPKTDEKDDRPFLPARAALAMTLLLLAGAKWASPSLPTLYHLAAVGESALALALLAVCGRGVLLAACVAFAGFAAASAYRLASGAGCGCMGSGIRPSNAVLLPACLLVAAACLLFYRAAGKFAYPFLAAGLCGIAASALFGRTMASGASPDALSPLVAASGLVDGEVVIVQHDCDHCRAVLDGLCNLSAGGRLDRVVIAELPPYASPRDARFLFPADVRRIHFPDNIEIPCFPAVVPVVDARASDVGCLSAPEDLIALIPSRSKP